MSSCKRHKLAVLAQIKKYYKKAALEDYYDHGGYRCLAQDREDQLSNLALVKN